MTVIRLHRKGGADIESPVSPPSLPQVTSKIEVTSTKVAKLVKFPDGFVTIETPEGKITFKPSTMDDREALVFTDALLSSFKETAPELEALRSVYLGPAVDGYVLNYRQAQDLPTTPALVAAPSKLPVRKAAIKSGLEVAILGPRVSRNV